MAQAGWLRALPALTLVAMLGPVAAGLAGTVLPAFGHMPSIGAQGPSLAPFAALLAWPGLGAAVWASVFTGLLATVVSVVAVALITAGWWGTGAFRWLERALSPLLAVPHAAAAFGLAFLIAPSGWLARLASPGLTGWERPLDWLIVHDPWGLLLVAGLAAKEIPFLLLMTLAALAQADVARSLRVAQALGHGRIAAWLLCVFPRIYAQTRLAVFVVLVFGMTVVDVALILGPTTPPPLSVQILRWMSDPDLSQRMTAAAGALLQLALVVATLGAWIGLERGVARSGKAWIAAGRRGRGGGAARAAGLLLGAGSALAVLGGLACLAVWSVAGFWGFPDPLPAFAGLRNWMRHAPGLWDAAADTAMVAGAAVAGALFLVVGCLEAEHRSGRPLRARGMWLIYLPLLVPQIAFLPGLQTLMLKVGADTGVAPVIAAHLVFVLPYVFLSLGDPWRAWDTRHARIAAGLGARPGAVFWRVRLPMMLRPVLTAAAVGFAVSVGQYLPTLLIGGGRVATLTTEAVALSAGGDRRAIGVHAIAQTAAALLPFAVALAVPAIVWRNRRGLHG
jgi:putative thiamine transport system permease protein